MAGTLTLLGCQSQTPQPAPKTVTDHIRDLGSREVGVRRRAALALLRAEPPAKAAVPALQDALGDGDEKVHSLVASSLANLAPATEGLAPIAVRLLRSDDEGIRYSAANMLRRLTRAGVRFDAEAAASALARALRDDDGFVRREAAITLCEMGPRANAAVPALLEVVTSPDYAGTDVPIFAAQALGTVGAEPGRAVPALIRCLNGHFLLRQSAATSLGMFGPSARDAVPALTRCLDDPQVRVEAAESLGRIGGEARSAVPALTKALGSDDQRYREAAKEAIRLIGDK